MKLLTGIFPFDRWRNQLCVKGRQNYPARSPRGTDFDTSGARLVRKSAQGLFSPWNKLSRQKCRLRENIASSRLVAPGSPRMPCHQSTRSRSRSDRWSKGNEEIGNEIAVHSDIISFPETTCLLASAKTQCSRIIHFKSPRFWDFRFHGACVPWFKTWCLEMKSMWMRIECLCGTNPHRYYLLTPFLSQSTHAPWYRKS